ncbi:MAG: VanZ family protein [Candidatus Izemoplasmataceae bacterium]|uniref:VanZ family protein n=1 Tax=Liberiplasma polymorphum TaxID=3374570 RepID=UPI003772FBE3
MTKLNHVLAWGLVVVWMGLIFTMSAKDATTSGELSGSLTLALANFFNITNISLLHTFIRKSAHFMIYLFLGIWCVNALSYHLLKVKTIYILSSLITLFYAISDEIHQTFIPGRSGEVMDVIIDFIGASIGIVFMITLKKHFNQR